MEKLKNAAILTVLFLAIIFGVVGVVGSVARLANDLEGAIQEVDGDGVRCFIYRDSISCIPGPEKLE